MIPIPESPAGPELREGTAPYAIPPDIEDEIERFEKEARDYVDGLSPEGEFTPFRLEHGIYGQKQDGVQMIRVKIPSGILTARQLRCFAEIAEKYGHGLGHVTTRQNFQFHFAKMENVPTVLRMLSRVGLTTREACGNTVRNVKACPYSGICPGEAFDVTPWSLAAARRFLRNPNTFKLPRKFKISFSGCPDDCGQGAINDIGLIARVREEGGKPVRGFTVKLGGGLSTRPQDAYLYDEFVPADEVLPVMEAAIRVFKRDGNYDRSKTGRAQSRMKWLIWKLGWEKFKAEVDEMRATLPKAVPVDPLPKVGQVQEPAPARNGVAPGAPFAKWREANVRAQRQKGYFAATAQVTLGDITPAQFRAIASAAETYGDGTVRTMDDQNLLLPWVREENLPALHAALAAIGFGDPKAGAVSDVTACPGADTCRLGITSSKGLAQELHDALSKACDDDPDLKGVHLKASGCPNSCGQHHIATIGFHGGVKKVGDRQLPYSLVMVGGGIDGKGATFGEKIGLIPARRCRIAVDRLLAHYKANRRPVESAAEYFRRADKKVLAALIADLGKENLDDPDLGTDCGKDKPYVFLGVGVGECAR